MCIVTEAIQRQGAQGGCGGDEGENQECVGSHGRRKRPHGGELSSVAFQSLGSPFGPSGLDPIICVTPGELYNICNLQFPLLPLCNLGKLNNMLYLTELFA